jgi:hypothetical protein
MTHFRLKFFFFRAAEKKILYIGSFESFVSYVFWFVLFNTQFYVLDNKLRLRRPFFTSVCCWQFFGDYDDAFLDLMVPAADSGYFIVY